MAWFIPLITAAAAATSIGGTIYQVAKGSGGGQQAPTAPGASAASSATDTTQEKAQIARQAPNIQSQLGGAVSPDYYAEEAAREAGFPGDSNVARTALSQFLGLGSVPDSQGTTPGFGTSNADSPFNPLSLKTGDGGGGSIFSDLMGGNQQEVSGGYS